AETTMQRLVTSAASRGLGVGCGDLRDQVARRFADGAVVSVTLTDSPLQASVFSEFAAWKSRSCR
ncbi:MAG TPA: hypothetical protein PLC86_18645, partial [Candidatus Accumulibacter phosphatis]|nr:hypothetical protein [Candidatus Accumulibacter phosphatis]